MIYDVEGTNILSAYDVNEETLSQAYSIDGESVFPDNINYDRYMFEDYINASVQNMQGFDTHNGYIFQMRATLGGMENLMALVRMSDGVVVDGNMNIYSGHGGSVSFSKEYYELNDLFPLLYVSTQYVPCTIYINRVNTSYTMLVKTLVFPLDKSGYYADQAYDLENNILYTVGYTENSYESSQSGANKVIISAWDMNNLTDNGDGTFTPAYISSVEREFIYTMQGKQFHDGMIWVGSGYYTASTSSYIYAISPVDGSILHTIDLETNTEVEGMSFISRNEMIVGLQGGTYKKCTFATA
jgi:hypothetical protein